MHFYVLGTSWLTEEIPHPIDSAEKITQICTMSISHFLGRCDAAAGALNLSRARLSTLLFGSGITIDRLASGAGVTVRVLERAEGRLRELLEQRGSIEDGEAA